MTHSSPERLSQLTTVWAELRQAHAGPDDQMAFTRRRLLESYRRAVYRYLLGGTRDPEAAEELCQEFALRFLRGDFHTADPRFGRFRDFLKTSLARLISRYHHKRSRLPQSLPAEMADGTGSQPDSAADAAFLQTWRDELLARAWEALRREQERSGRPVYLVLRYKVDHPDLSSPELAAGIGELVGRDLTAAAVRQALHRAREVFAALLYDEVAATLDNPNPDQLEEELVELNLHRYCKMAHA